MVSGVWDATDNCGTHSDGNHNGSPECGTFAVESYRRAVFRFPGFIICQQRNLPARTMSAEQFEWYPAELLRAPHRTQTPGFALIMLNQPLQDQHLGVIRHLWDNGLFEP
jgi:hypothetical protein